MECLLINMLTLIALRSSFEQYSHLVLTDIVFVYSVTQLSFSFIEAKSYNDLLIIVMINQDS